MRLSGRDELKEDYWQLNPSFQVGTVLNDGQMKLVVAQ